MTLISHKNGKKLFWVLNKFWFEDKIRLELCSSLVDGNPLVPTGWRYKVCCEMIELDGSECFVVVMVHFSPLSMSTYKCHHFPPLIIISIFNAEYEINFTNMRD